jgi:hypothetical protein
MKLKNEEDSLQTNSNKFKCESKNEENKNKNEAVYSFKEWNIKENDIDSLEKILNGTNNEQIDDFDEILKEKTILKIKQNELDETVCFKLKINSFKMGSYINTSPTFVEFSNEHGINFKLIGN